MLRPSLLALSCCALLPAQQSPPPGFETPDHEIEIGVLPARLRYDTERFAVAPGSKVKLTLVNGDEMQHNLLICKPGDGVAQKVGMAALQLGAEATAKQFVPDVPEVLWHTKAILPGERDTIWFTAPDAEGAYPYVCTLPGHMFTMKGVMTVGDAPAAGSAAPLTAATWKAYEGKWSKLPDFAALEPVATGELAEGLIDLAPVARRANYGVCFEATLNLPADGAYTFLLNSDDGSRLFVDGEKVTEWDGTHPGGKEREGKVTLTAGAHALRVDFFQGGGGQLLGVAYRDPEGQRVVLSAAKPNRRAEPAGIPLAVHHHSRLMRVHVEGAAARTVAVGLHGGTNYAFDAERCSVQFGWSGAFLDVGPDRLGRGGRPCKTLGPRFTVGDLGFPLRTADGGSLPVRFQGYRNGMAPEFLLDWGGREVRWSISPAAAGIGLSYRFQVGGTPGSVRFLFDPKAVRCTSSTGMVGGGTLAIQASESRDFTVTITPLQEGNE